MKNFIPYIIFACLSGFTATSGIPLLAGGCTSHINKTVKMECSKDDKDCQKEKAAKFELKEATRS